jgi:hypothetical protein
VACSAFSGLEYSRPCCSGNPDWGPLQEFFRPAQTTGPTHRASCMGTRSEILALGRKPHVPVSFECAGNTSGCRQSGSDPSRTAKCGNSEKGHPDDPPWLFFTASTSAWTAVPSSVWPTSSSERRQSASSTHYSASGDAVAVVLRSQIQFRVNADREREYLREHARWQSVHRVCCAGSPALEEPIQGSLG